MSRDRRRRWTVGVAVLLMLAALFAYVASLDEADPEALPETAADLEQGAP